LRSIFVDSAFINGNPESVIPVALINYLLLNFAKLFQWKSLEGLWQASWIW